MENIIQRFHQLSADIETLRILVDESEAKLMMFNDCYKMMGKMDSKKLAEFGKKNETMYLDFIRNHISIVRKISPTIANDLEIRANEFERIVPSFFNILIEKKELIKNQKKILSDKNYLIKLMNEEGDDLKKISKIKKDIRKLKVY